MIGLLRTLAAAGVTIALLLCVSDKIHLVIAGALLFALVAVLCLWFPEIVEDP